MLNILLGQKLMPDGKLRVHWQLDEEFYPAKPFSSVGIDQTRKIIVTEEAWLDAKRENFQGFTIPYYDFIYMKDINEMDEAYIIQPFEHDLVVLDLSLDMEQLQQAFTVADTDREEDTVVLFNTDKELSIVEDFQVVAGFDKKLNKSYDKEKIQEVDMAIGFKDIWKEDLGRIAEAYSYATLIGQGSIENAIKRGDSKEWGE